MKTLTTNHWGLKSRFFKRTLAAFILSLAASTLIAQSLHLISSNPAFNSAGVAINTTVSFTFNTAIDTTTIFFNWDGDTYQVFPSDAIDIHEVGFSNDLTTVFFNVTHAADTDFVWYFTKVKTAEGGYQAKAEMLTYTTRPANSSVIVSGQLHFNNEPPYLYKSVEQTASGPDMAFNALLSFFENAVSPDELATVPEQTLYPKTLTVLLDNLDFMENGGDNGPGNALKHAGLTNPSTGIYTIQNVQPGQYYVLSVLFEFGYREYAVVGIGIYEDTEGQPLQITVEETDVTGVDITLNGFFPELIDPVDASTAIGIIKPVVSADHPNAQLIVAMGSETKNPRDIYYKSFGGASVYSPSGTSYFWEAVYLDLPDSMIYVYLTMGEEVSQQLSFHVSEIPSDEGGDIDFSELKTIPDDFLPSAMALSTAMMHGLDSLRASGNAYYEDFHYTLSSLYFEFPEFLTSESNPFWSIQYYANEDIVHENTTEYSFTDADFIVDAITGAFIGKEIYTGTWHGGSESFSLLNSSPMHMSTGVPLQTQVSFTFDDVVNMGSFDMGMMGMNFSVMPADKVHFETVTLSEDQQTVIFTVEHEPGIDYVWSLLNIHSFSGNLLDQVYVLNYTTAPEISNLFISGSVFLPDMHHPESVTPIGGLLNDVSGNPAYVESNALRVVVALFSDDSWFREGGNGEPSGIVNAGALNIETGYYMIHNVRPGDYYLGAFVFDLSFGSPNVIAYGYYDDDFGNPEQVSVSDFSLTGVDIPIYTGPFEPFGLVDARELADTVRNRVRHNNEETGLIMSYGREELRLPEMPVGKSHEWMFVYYNPVSEMVDMVFARKDSIHEHQRIHINDIPENERGPVDSITVITDEWIPSVQALQIAMDNGMRTLLEDLPDAAWGRVGYSLNGFWYEFPDFMNEHSNPVWLVDLEAEIANEQFEILYSVDADFFIDAYDGTYIGKSVITSADKPTELPAETTLYQNYPNPFNPSTSIRWDLAENSRVTIRVYDVLGREVATLVNAVYEAGAHRVVFDASTLSSGVYLYRMETEASVTMRKMTLIK